MNVAVDIGNTLIKIGIFKEDQLIEAHQLENDDTAAEAIRKYSPQHLIISSVTKNSENLIGKISSSIRILELNHSTSLPVTIAYETPRTLGADRISAAVGAYSIYPNQNNLVIDMGTCIKCDLINDKNQYLGGSISPGIRMRFRSLHDFTSKLPLIEAEEINFLNGKSTKDSILSGVINGAWYEIQGFIFEYEKIFSPLNVIITGGDAYSFESRTKPHIFVVPNLVLLGLNKILLHNLSNTGA